MRTQVASSVLAERLPAMCVNETFATEVSRTSMNVADITAAAISQGLAAGLQGWAAAVGVPFAIDDYAGCLTLGGLVPHQRMPRIAVATKAETIINCRAE